MIYIVRDLNTANLWAWSVFFSVYVNDLCWLTVPIFPAHINHGLAWPVELKSPQEKKLIFLYQYFEKNKIGHLDFFRTENNVKYSVGRLSFIFTYLLNLTDLQSEIITYLESAWKTEYILIVFLEIFFSCLWSPVRVWWNNELCQKLKWPMGS